MIICPVCENQQPSGTECTVCGKVFAAAVPAAALPVPAEQIEGLELTSSQAVGELPVDRVAELDVGRFTEVQVPVERAPDLELNALAQVGEVPVERVADLSDDRAADDGVRAVRPVGPATCRYCGNVQATGLVCERCGMRLPFRPTQAANAPAAVPARTARKFRSEEPVRVRCHQCGAVATAGQRCKDCGNAVPFPEAT